FLSVPGHPIWYLRHLRHLRPSRSPASGPSPSIPNWRCTAIGGSLSRSFLNHPLAGLWSTLRSNFWTTSNRRRSMPDEVSLCPLRQPDEAAVRRSARAGLVVGRL